MVWFGKSEVLNLILKTIDIIFLELNKYPQFISEFLSSKSNIFFFIF